MVFSNVFVPQEPIPQPEPTPEPTPTPEPKPPVEDVPQRAPQTGDGVAIGTWSTLSIGALIICGYLLISGKRRRNEF
jgi:hypothetical protein